MSAFTPGPLYTTSSPLDTLETIHAPDGEILCVIERRDDDTPADWARRKADARLWASAWEMYALLEGLADESEAHMIGTRLGQARALLAKIEGAA